MPVRNFPNLCERLGASKVDQICFQAVVEYTPGSKRVRTILNPHRQRLMWDRFGDKPEVDDILSGIARLDYGSDKGLSASRLHTILKSTDRISSELLCDVMRITDRQARRYMAGVRLAIFHLNRHTHYHPDEETNEPYEDPCRTGQPPPSVAS